VAPAPTKFWARAALMANTNNITQSNVFFTESSLQKSCQ